MRLGLFCHSSKPALDLHPKVVWLLVLTVNVAPPASILNAYLRVDASTRPRVIRAECIRRSMTTPTRLDCYCLRFHRAISISSQTMKQNITNPSRTPTTIIAIPIQANTFNAIIKTSGTIGNLRSCVSSFPPCQPDQFNSEIIDFITVWFFGQSRMN